MEAQLIMLLVTLILVNCYVQNVFGGLLGGMSQAAPYPSHIKGGIGDGYIYPISYAPSQSIHAAAHHPHKPGNVRTYQLIFEQSPGVGHGRHAGATSDVDTGSVKILKVIHMRAAAAANADHHGHEYAGHVHTVKLIHVPDAQNCIDNIPEEKAKYNVDLPVVNESGWQ